MMFLLQVHSATDEDKVGAFKDASREFRQGKMTADEYYCKVPNSYLCIYAY